MFIVPAFGVGMISLPTAYGLILIFKCFYTARYNAYAETNNFWRQIYVAAMTDVIICFILWAVGSIVFRLS